jgi:hydrogenase maturation protease
VTRVLIACVGNILRGDDGFGVVVAEHLGQHVLPSGVDLIETGIGGMSIVQQLMDGYDALIVVDAVDRGARPGTLFVLEPQIADPGGLSTDEWRQQFSNLHLAEPSRVLPRTVTIVGCQPECTQDYEPSLSPSVQRAVALATKRIVEMATSLATAQVG